MTAITLNDALNTIIPILIFAFLAWVLYKPFKEPLSSLFSKISEWKDRKQDSSEGGNIIKTITYE